MEKKTLDDLLEEWSVLPPGQWDNDHGPKDWFAVCNNEGIRAYFEDETDAFRWRISMINLALNPVSKTDK